MVTSNQPKKGPTLYELKRERDELSTIKKVYADPISSNSSYINQRLACLDRAIAKKITNCRVGALDNTIIGVLTEFIGEVRERGLFQKIQYFENTLDSISKEIDQIYERYRPSPIPESENSKVDELETRRTDLNSKLDRLGKQVKSVFRATVETEPKIGLGNYPLLLPVLKVPASLSKGLTCTKEVHQSLYNIIYTETKAFLEENPSYLVDSDKPIEVPNAKMRRNIGPIKRLTSKISSTFVDGLKTNIEANAEDIAALQKGITNKARETEALYNILNALAVLDKKERALRGYVKEIR